MKGHPEVNERFIRSWYYPGKAAADLGEDLRGEINIAIDRCLNLVLDYAKEFKIAFKDVYSGHNSI